MKYNKLIRDRIPEIIEAKGGRCSYHVASDDEYREKLYEKLEEESRELIEERNVNEIADVLEVLDAIMDLEGISGEEVEKIKQEKHEKRGGFEKKLILEES